MKGKIKIEIEKLKFEIEETTKIISTLFIGLFLGISIPLLLTMEKLSVKIGIAIIILVVSIAIMIIYYLFSSGRYSKINNLYEELLK